MSASKLEWHHGGCSYAACDCGYEDQVSAEKDARIERLEKTLEGIEATPCLAAILGEENPECGCASCTAREALKR